MRPRQTPTTLRRRRGPSGPQLLAALLGCITLLAAGLAYHVLRKPSGPGAESRSAQHSPTPLLAPPGPSQIPAPLAGTTPVPLATASTSPLSLAPTAGAQTPGPPTAEQGSVSHALLARVHELVRQGDTREARGLLAERLRQSEDPRLRVLLAAIYLREDDAASASRQLERVPPELRDADWYGLKGRALYQLGKLREAEQALERAVALGAPLAELLQKVRREQEQVGTLRARTSEHFTLAIEGDPAPQLAHAVLAAAEDGYRRLNRDFKLSFHGKFPIILHTRQSFAEVTRAPDWAGALYDGKLRLPAGDLHRVTSAFEQVLVHELAHAMIRQKAGSHCPGWLHEGIAQYYEGRRFQSRWRQLGSPSADILLAARTQTEPALYYLRALALVEFIRHRYGPTSVMRLLDALRTEAGWEAALRRALRSGSSRFEQEWEDWLRRKTR